MRDEFWVVGGSYRDATFAALDADAGELHGPFETYDHALRCWRERTAETRSKATTRFTVVTSAAQPAGRHQAGQRVAYPHQ